MRSIRRSADFYIALAGRILLGGFFLWSGILNVLDFSQISSIFASANIPLSSFFGTAVVLIEIGAGIAVVMGWKLRFASALLLLYLAFITFLLHNSFNDPSQMAVFLQNLAIMGGLLYLFAYSPRT